MGSAAQFRANPDCPEWAHRSLGERTAAAVRLNATRFPDPVTIFGTRSCRLLECAFHSVLLCRTLTHIKDSTLEDRNVRYSCICRNVSISHQSSAAFSPIKANSSFQSGLHFHLHKTAAAPSALGQQSDLVQHQWTSSTFASQHVPVLPLHIVVLCVPAPYPSFHHMLVQQQELPVTAWTHREADLPPQLAAALQHTTSAGSKMKQDYLVHTRTFSFLREAKEERC